MSAKKYEISHEDVILFANVLGTAEGLAEILESMGHKTIPDKAREVFQDAEKALRSLTPILGASI
jgi:hypothetical protein